MGRKRKNVPEPSQRKQQRGLCHPHTSSCILTLHLSWSHFQYLPYTGRGQKKKNNQLSCLRKGKYILTHSQYGAPYLAQNMYCHAQNYLLWSSRHQFLLAIILDISYLSIKLHIIGLCLLQLYREHFQFFLQPSHFLQKVSNVKELFTKEQEASFKK